MKKAGIILKLVIGVVVVGAWLWFLPPRWWLNSIKPVDQTDPVSAGQTVVEKYECRECHLIGEDGNRLKAPDLNHVVERLDATSLRLWLLDPRSIRWKTLMPNFHLSDPEIEAILAYLDSLNDLNDQ